MAFRLAGMHRKCMEYGIAATVRHVSHVADGRWQTICQHRRLESSQLQVSFYKSEILFEVRTHTELVEDFPQTIEHTIFAAM